MCLIEYHKMKAYGGVEVSCIILNCEIRSEWPASHPNSSPGNETSIPIEWYPGWSLKAKKSLVTVANRTAILRSQSQCRLNCPCSLYDAWPESIRTDAVK